MNPTTFRWDPDLSVLWAGERSYPATFQRHSMHDDIPEGSDFLEQFPDYRMESRQCWVRCENRWQLSVIWGDATFSSNAMFAMSGLQPFVEEPTLVEVGVLLPEPQTRPRQVIAGREIPQRESHLWGEPLGYVDVAHFHRVADLVMHLPTDIELPEGEWDSAQGFCDFLITAGLDRTMQ